MLVFEKRHNKFPAHILFRQFLQSFALTFRYFKYKSANIGIYSVNLFFVAEKLSVYYALAVAHAPDFIPHSAENNRSRRRNTHGLTRFVNTCNRF